MSRLSMLMVVALLLVSTLSMAQSSDIIGVYFDEAASVAEIGIPPYTPFFAYFMLVNGTASGVAGYEFGYQVEVAPGLESAFFRLLTIYPVDIITLHVDDLDPTDGEYVLGWGTPLPMQPAFRLLTWQLMLLQPMTAHITTRAVSTPSEPWGVPLYTDGTNVYGMTEPDCSGWINSFCPVATETRSFGAIKSLYR